MLGASWRVGRIAGIEVRIDRSWGVAWLLAGDLAGGIWFAVIGWFLVQAARSSSQDLQLQLLLRGSRPRT